MKKRALVVGGGISALCCAKLLARHGWKVVVWVASPRPTPALVLNSVTCDLLLDVWQAGDDLLKGSYPLNERKTRWGQEGTVSTVAQPSLAIRGDLLIAHFLECLSREHNLEVHIDDFPVHLCKMMDPISFSRSVQEFDWVVDASGRASQIAQLLGAVKYHSFGQRCVIGMEVPLTKTNQGYTYWIEAVQDGWVFLAPLERDRALLQAMLPTVSKEPFIAITDLLAQTRMIRTQVADVSGPASVFIASPQIADPLCGPGWIAVGDAAISLDPISGDGTGYAIRGVILAVGVLNGIASGLPRSDCLHHYSLRLQKAFFSHLRECISYYSVVFSSLAWKTEIELMKHAFPNDRYHTTDAESFLYGLKGFELVPLHWKGGT